MTLLLLLASSLHSVSELVHDRYRTTERTAGEWSWSESSSFPLTVMQPVQPISSTADLISRIGFCCSCKNRKEMHKFLAFAVCTTEAVIIKYRFRSSSLIPERSLVLSSDPITFVHPSQKTSHVVLPAKHSSAVIVSSFQILHPLNSYYPQKERMELRQKM